MTNALLPPAERRVGRLRVRAREEADARHLAIVLADALRTATLPGANEGQLLVVRKLRLARISRSASSSTLALRIERAMREARLAAISFTLPSAATANAVIFPGRVEALAALARFHARGIQPTQWFWKAVAPHWAQPQSRGARWLALIEAALVLPEGSIASAQILGEAFRAGVEDELLGALPPGRGAEWLRAAGWSTFEVTRSRRAGRDEIEDALNGLLPSLQAGVDAKSGDPTAKWRGRHRAAVERWEPRWQEEGVDRLVWLIAMLEVLSNPARAGDPGLALFASKQVASARMEPGAHRLPPVVPRSSAEESARSQLNRVEPGKHRQQPVVPRSSGEESGRSQPNDSAVVVETLSARIESGSDGFPSRIFSSCAGLLFLVPVLERLGFPDFLTANPDLIEGGFPARFLRFAAARLGMPADDPLAIAFDQSPSLEEPFSRREMPALARELLADRPPRSHLDTLRIAWLTVARRWCRRRARIGLASLVRRPGYVAIGQAQIDLFFHLASADLRLRRAALDVDPGWVPWLGQVVRFHYVEANEGRY